MSALVDRVPGPVVAGVAASWPAGFRPGRGARLGVTLDPDFGSVIRMHLAESAAVVSG